MFRIKFFIYKYLLLNFFNFMPAGTSLCLLPTTPYRSQHCSALVFRREKTTKISGASVNDSVRGKTFALSAFRASVNRALLFGKIIFFCLLPNLLLSLLHLTKSRERSYAINREPKKQLSTCVSLRFFLYAGRLYLALRLCSSMLHFHK